MTMFTEHEAEQQWCPLSRSDERFYNSTNQRTEVASASINRTGYGGTLPGCNCLASECMAWRWDPQQPRDTDKRGYCGAFGKPAP